MKSLIVLLIIIIVNLCLTVIIVKKMIVKIVKSMDLRIDSELSQINSTLSEVFNYEKSIIKCINCGNEIDIEDNYCNRCGLKLLQKRKECK